MITVTRTFETTAALADWIAAQPHEGQLTAEVGSSTLTITYGTPTTIDCVVGLLESSHSFANAKDATRYWVGRIRAAADASAESYNTLLKS